MDHEMLEAHVRFELERLTGAGWADDVRSMVAAAFAALADATWSDVLPQDQVVAVIAEQVLERPMSRAARESVVEAVVAAYADLAANDTTIGSLVGEAEVDRLVEIVVSMTPVHEAVVGRITESSAYTRLVAYVLYQGVKSYVLRENLLTRRVPGASSLVRLGQMGLQTAAPNLEKGIDAQLTAFVDASISDTVRDSRHYVSSMMNEQTLTTLFNEARAATSEDTVGGIVSLVEEDQIRAVSEVVLDVVDGARRSTAVRQRVERIVADVYADHGHRPALDVLADYGLTPDVTTRALVTATEPLLQRWRDSGALEDAVRSRLAPFYESYGRSQDHSSRPGHV
jgi:hypothetical protein